VKRATIHGVTYEGVVEFKSLGTLISNDNSIEKEIQRRILAGNRTYFAAISLLRSQLSSRATKIILYKTLIKLVVSYGAEALTLMKKEQAPLIFERKIFRRKYGPKYENGNRKVGSRGDKARKKYIKMDKKAKDKLVRSPGENGGGKYTQKDLHSRTGRDDAMEKTQERMERGRRNRSSSAGSEKMERVGGR